MIKVVKEGESAFHAILLSHMEGLPPDVVIIFIGITSTVQLYVITFMKISHFFLAKVYLFVDEQPISIHTYTYIKKIHTI